MSILKPKKDIKYSDYEKNRENPFIKQAIEEIDKNTVKKYKSSAGTDQKAVLQAFNPDTGELLGHTSFIRQIEVDEEQFTKFYLSNFKAFYGLSEKAIRIFGYILTKLTPNRDEFILIVEDCMSETSYKTKPSIYSALAELLKAEIIARGRTDVLFYINPMIIFNGNRVTFVKTYVKKTVTKSLKAKQKEMTNRDQLDLFDNEEVT